MATPKDTWYIDSQTQFGNTLFYFRDAKTGMPVGQGNLREASIHILNDKPLIAELR